MRNLYLETSHNPLCAYLKNLPLEKGTKYILTLDMLGGELEIYLNKSSLTPAGLYRFCATPTWTTVSLSFSTVTSGAYTKSKDWGIAFLKTAEANHYYGSVLGTTYIDNVHLFCADDPKTDLLTGGDFSKPQLSPIYNTHWRTEFLSPAALETGVRITTDPLNPKNRCLKFPSTLRNISYSSSHPLQLRNVIRFHAPERPISDIALNGIPQYMFLLIVSGTATLSVDGVPSTLAADSLLYLPPYTPFQYTLHDSQDGLYYCIRADGKELSELLRALQLETAAIIGLSDIRVLTNRIDRILRLKEKSATYLHTVNGYFAVFLSELERQQKSESFHTKFYHRMEEVAEQLQRYPEKHFSNSQLAQSIGLSTGYFITQFKNLYGIPPQQYRLDSLIARARNLLRSTEMTIQEIATTLGIEDSLYFSRTFRRIEGMSPTEYRQQFHKPRNTP